MATTFDATPGPNPVLQTNASKSVFRLPFALDTSNFLNLVDGVPTAETGGIAVGETVTLVKIPPMSYVFGGEVTVVDGQTSAASAGHENPSFSLGDETYPTAFAGSVIATTAEEGHTTVFQGIPRAYPDGGVLVLTNNSSASTAANSSVLGISSEADHHLTLTGNLYCLPME